MSNKPAKIYRYHSFSARTLAEVKKRTIFFSDPIRFNDPFDCPLPEQLRDMSDDECHEYLDFCEKAYPEELGFLKGKMLDSETCDFIRNQASKLFQENIMDLFRGKGVCCFSASNTHPLLWGHYADGHKGFCLEFDTNSKYFVEKLNEVNYSGKLPIFSPLALFRNEFDLQDPGLKILQDVLCTKSKAWEYEEEWRLLHNEADKEFGYGVSALTGIYFGARMLFRGCPKNPNFAN